MRKILLIALLLFSFSGKAQKVDKFINLKIEESDVYFGLIDRAEIFVKNLYQLALENKISVYKDSLLLKKIEASERMFFTSYSLKVMNGWKLSQDTNDFVDTLVIGPPSFYPEFIKIDKDFIHLHKHFKFDYYFKKNELENYLSISDKQFLKVIGIFFENNFTREIVDSFPKDFIKKQNEKIYLLGRNNIVKPYQKNYDDNNFLIMEEDTNIIYSVPYDTIINTSFSIEKTQGFGVVYKQISYTFNHISTELLEFYPMYKPFVVGVELNAQPLFYMNSKQVFENYSSSEVYLWEIILAYNFKRNLDNKSYPTMEDYVDFKK